ncbi:MAG: hypothetical protein AB1521_11325 [Bacteroidota bacterium]
MKAGIFLTGSGPIVIITSYDSFTHPNLVKKLFSKGIKKFIVYEIPLQEAVEKYGHHYDAVMDDLQQEDDLRVLDYDGHHIFAKFSFKDFGVPVLYE